MFQFQNTLKKLVTVLFIVIFSVEISYAKAEKAVMTGASTTQTRQTNQAVETFETIHELVGKASFYGDEFQGRMTANGEIFDNAQLLLVISQ